jgi:MraZ protein
VFLGEFEQKCDNKNRFRIPNKFKKDVNGEIVLLKGNDGCIFILSKNAFEELVSKANELPMFDSKVQKPLRLIFSSASELDEDNQGRFLLPNNLKKYASIDKDIVFVGAGNRIELWAKEKWDSYCKSENTHIQELLQGLGDYGI